MKNTNHTHPLLTVDCVVFGLDEEDLKVLLIQRGIDPFKDYWALPGGFLRTEEDLEMAAYRELKEETGVSPDYLEQFHTFSGIARDPRGHIVTTAYYALVNLSDHNVKAATDACDAGWFAINDLPRLAFDHEMIFEMALERFRSMIRYHPIGFELLPKKFTLSALQNLYEKVLDQKIDKRNFRKKILSTSLLQETTEIQQGVAHRAARLYQFDHIKYKKLKKSGFQFQI